MKSRVSEIRVKQIRVNQGVGVYEKDFCFQLRFGEDLFYEIPYTLDGIVVVAVVSLLQNKT